MPFLKLDLWELPHSRHTDTITVDIERNFYSRCPPNKRPAYLHRLPSDAPLSHSEPELGKTESMGAVGEGKGDKTSAVSEEKGDQTGNVEPSKTEENSKKYDESLFKALHRTFFKRIWISAVLLVASGKRKSTFRNFLFITYAQQTRSERPLLY